MHTRAGMMDYSARTSYLDPEKVARYETDRFSGFLGRYRWRREQSAVSSLVASLPSGLTTLDCPCGIGRWWPVLSQRATAIHAVDISPAMLDAASHNARSSNLDVSLSHGAAEALPFEDASHDLVFSFALTKHLPVAAQQAALQEFSRVSRRFVLCTFSIVHHITYEFWRRRQLVDSYPLLPEQLLQMASAAGLSVGDLRRCTTPIGVEHLVLLHKS